MAHTYDDPKTAIEYAALLLEQDDAGGTLPGLLRQYAEAYGDLLAACEALLAACEHETRGRQIPCWDAIGQTRAAVAKARGESS